jgi:cytochrome c oxidase subunit 2
MALAIVLSLLLAGCAGSQSALDVHGASAISLKQLIILIVAVCSVVWALVMVVLIFAIWRRREEGERPLLPDSGTERRMTAAVTSAVVVSVVVIAALTVFSFFTTRALSVAGNNDLTIKVRGQQ